VPSAPPASAALVDDIRADANWILSARLADGAIANYTDKQAVWPYLSNFAAMGLARAFEVTRDSRYINAAWQWASWYQAHMDTQGFVTDYTISNGVLTSTGFMDSTDAYAGTFLLAVRDAFRADANLSKLNGLKTGIAKAVKAIEATQTADGLTWAKPTWRVKYLMDQGETYAGLLAAAELARKLNNTTLANRATTDAKRMRTGVGTLWNSSVSAYDWAKHANDARTATNWSYLYSDALQQAWSVAFGLVDPTRDVGLMTRFTTSQPKWAQPTSTALFSGGATDLVGYWPVAGLALRRVAKDPSAALLSIRSAAIASNRAWPFTTGNAGQLILLQASSLSGARTLDAKILLTSRSRTTSFTTSTVARVPTPTRTSSPASSPRPTVAPTPTPAPTQAAAVDAQIGPVTAEGDVGPNGVNAQVTPLPDGSQPTPTP
jgi:hypothetical protein